MKRVLLEMNTLFEYLQRLHTLEHILTNHKLYYFNILGDFNVYPFMRKA